MGLDNQGGAVDLQALINQYLQSIAGGQMAMPSAAAPQSAPATASLDRQRRTVAAPTSPSATSPIDDTILPPDQPPDDPTINNGTDPRLDLSNNDRIMQMLNTMNPGDGVPSQKFQPRSINLVDTRTDHMRNLEDWSAPMLQGMLSNPAEQFGRMFGSAPVPGQQGFDQGNPSMEMLQAFLPTMGQTGSNLGGANNPFEGFLGQILGGQMQQPIITPGQPNPIIPPGGYHGGTGLPPTGGGVLPGTDDPNPPTGYEPNPAPFGYGPRLPGQAPASAYPGGYVDPNKPLGPTPPPPEGFRARKPPVERRPQGRMDINPGSTTVTDTTTDPSRRSRINDPAFPVFDPLDAWGLEDSLQDKTPQPAPPAGTPPGSIGTYTEPVGNETKGVVDPTDLNYPEVWRQNEEIRKAKLLGQPEPTFDIPYDVAFNDLYQHDILGGRNAPIEGWIEWVRPHGNDPQPTGSKKLWIGPSNPDFAANQERLNALGLDSKVMGGTLNPNVPTMVGEQGPEMLLGNQVIPNDMLPQALAAFAGQPMQGAATGGIFENPIEYGNVAGSGFGEGSAIPPSNVTPFQNTFNPTSIGGQDPIAQVTGGQAPNNVFANLLSQNPEMQTFNQSQDLLNQNFFGQNPGQSVMDALQPKFEENLSFGLAEQANRAPSVSNSALGLEGMNLTQRALNDFNLLGAQSMQQGLDQQLAGLQTQGALAGQAGQNPMNRALGVGELGLEQRGQDINQQLGLGTLGSQYRGQDIQQLLGQQGMDLNQLLGLGGLAIQGRGQDLNQQLGLRGQDFSQQLGLTNLAQQQQQFGSSFGLAQNQQSWDQNQGAALQLLMQLLPMLGPTGLQTVAMGG